MDARAVVTVAVLIPYRPDGSPARAQAVMWVRERYRVRHRDYSTIVGWAAPLSEPWSKGRAVQSLRASLDEVEHGDVLVIADADSWVDGDYLEAAVEAVQGGAPWAVPHRKVLRYTKGTTATILAGAVPTRYGIERRHEACEGGGIVVVSADVYDAIGGIDPRFVGWGGEDEAFGLTLRCLYGGPVQISGTLHHLWHEHAVGVARHRPPDPTSAALLERYRAAVNDPERMRTLITER